ncbi:hypothetical protein ABPG72_018514 [Tetrahymena utriculariae]
MNCGNFKGQIYYCKGKGCTSNGTVWGSNPYTSDSNYCVAARHSGIVGEGGNYYAVNQLPAQQSYSGSNRNGVTTSNYGSYHSSISLRQISDSERNEINYQCYKCKKFIQGDLIINRSGYTTGTYLGINCFFDDCGYLSWVYFVCDQCNLARKNSPQQQLNELNIQISSLNIQISNKDQQINSLNTQINQQSNELNTKIQQQNTQISNKDQQINSLNTLIEQQKNQITQLQNKINQLDGEIDEKQKEYEQQIQQFMDQKEIINPMKLNEHNMDDLKQKLRDAEELISKQKKQTNQCMCKDSSYFESLNDSQSTIDQSISNLKHIGTEEQNISQSQLIFTKQSEQKYQNILISSLRQYTNLFLKFNETFTENKVKLLLNQSHEDFFNSLRQLFDQHLCNQINQMTLNIKQEVSNIQEFYQQSKKQCEVNCFNEDIQQQILGLIEKQIQLKINSDEILIQFKESIEKQQQQIASISPSIKSIN